MADPKSTQRQELKRAAASGSKWNAAATVASNLLQMVQIAILARALTTEDFGLVAVATVVVGLLQKLGDMGFTLAIMHRQDSTDEQLSSLFWLNTVFGAVLYGVVLAATPPLEAWFEAPELSSVLHLLALMLLIAPLGQVFQTLLWREMHFRALAMVETGAALAGTVAVVAGLAGGLGVLAYVLGFVGKSVVQTLCAVLLGRRIWWPRLRFAWSDLRGYLAFGSFQAAEQLITFVAKNVDKVVIGAVLGKAPLGAYNPAWNLITRPVNAINPIITKVSFPVLSRIQDDDAALRRIYLKTIESVALINVPVFLGMFAVAEPLIGAYLGRGWATDNPETAQAVEILAFVGVLFAISNPIGSLFTAKGRADLGLTLSFAGVGLYLLAVWFGAQWGVTGVAWAVLLATVANKPLELWLLHVVVRMRPWDYARTVLPYLVLAGAMAAAVRVLDALLDGASAWLRLLVLVPVGMVVYGGLLFVFRRAFCREVLDLLRGR